MNENQNNSTINRKSVTAEVLARYQSLVAERNTNTDNSQRYCELDEQIFSLFEEYDFMDKEFTENGLVGLRRADGSVIIPAAFDQIPYSYRLDVKVPAYPVRKGGFAGIVKADGSGNLITPCEYDSIEFDFPSYFFLTIKNERVGVLSIDGKEIAPNEITNIGEMCDGIMPIMQGEKWGFITQFGEYVKPEFDELGEICTGVGPIAVRKGDQWGFVEQETHRFITNEEAEESDYNLICDAESYLD